MSWLSSLFTRLAPPPRSRSTSSLFFTNTLSGKKELFTPLKPGVVTLYSCGPTVYSRAHIGNLRAYVFADILARTLSAAGLHVRRVINITDVGHLTGDNTGDADTGEDRMEEGARREGVSVSEITARYTNLFENDLRALGVDTVDISFPRATDYIKEQVAMIQSLQEKGYAYRIRDGIYFDTSKFPNYGVLGGVSTADLEEGARVAINTEKRNASDFALWKFSSSTSQKRLQEWDSPWGRGFPGWHIECSAMSRSLLGETIDIHTGGIDHIPVHHNNEIAQSEAASGKRFVRYWMHGAFLNIASERIGKSIGNVLYLSDITDRGYEPLALRYLLLQGHYRTEMNFTWDSLAASHEALVRLWRLVRDIRTDAKRPPEPTLTSERITAMLRDDLATAKALALLWESLRNDELSPEEKMAVIIAADAVLGLSLLTPPETQKPKVLSDLPDTIRSLIARRDSARLAKDFLESDRLRHELQNSGYRVDDGPAGTIVTLQRGTGESHNS